MDLYQLPHGHPESFPEGYKFSWTAFIPDGDGRVLFDCHPPKGPHMHIDGDIEGTPFRWVSPENAYDLFFEKIKELFGEFKEEYI